MTTLTCRQQAFVAAMALSLQVGGSVAQTNVEESFDRGQLSALWNSCQATARLNAARVVDQASDNIAYYFGIDDTVELPPCDCQTRTQCAGHRPAPDIEPLPYQVANLPMALPAGDPCLRYDPNRIPPKQVLQKNELRLWREDWPQASAGTWFSFRFRIEGKIDRCGSMRWVGGQIKVHGMDESPIVAQRFDNGVFHITVEGGHRIANRMERVIVAKATGDPDRGSSLTSWASGETVTCDMSTGTPRPDGCGIAGRVIPLGGSLPSIDGGRWIQMDYYLRIVGACDPADPESCDRILEVWADGNPIVRVEGRFGVEGAEAGLLNVKLGIYRDFQAGNAGMSVDHFSMRYDPQQMWSPEQREEPEKATQVVADAAGL